MSHELWLAKDSTLTDITPLIGSITRRSNKDELGEEISFDVAFTDTRFFPKNPCDIGDLVILRNNQIELTRTIIVEEGKVGRGAVPYTSFDYAFYLNKSDSLYQFNGVTADEAIAKICSDFGVPIGNITRIPTKIKKIFNGKKLSEILKEIIQIVEHDQGKDYLMEMRQGKLFVEKQEDLLITGTFQLADNLNENNITDAISNPSRKRSITDMVNSIKIVSNDKVVLTKNSSTMMSKYGKLQKTISVDEEQKKKAKQIAQRELEQFAKVAEEIGIELLGDDRVRAGRLLKLEEPITGISGTFLINSANHIINKRIHKMSLFLSKGEM